MIFISNSQAFVQKTPFPESFQIDTLFIKGVSSLPQNLPAALRSKRAYALAMQLNCRAGRPDKATALIAGAPDCIICQLCKMNSNLLRRRRERERERERASEKERASERERGSSARFVALAALLRCAGRRVEG